jgi:diacylglycerol kinase family enzyme
LENLWKKTELRRLTRALSAGRYGGDMSKSEVRTVQLIYNPTAGRHCDKRLDALRLGFEAGGARVIVSECGPGSEIIISDEAHHVCALGGDGTVRHVALALSRSSRSLPLSIYPGGTINLVHREILSPLDPGEHAARALSGASSRDHYCVELNDTLFLACASVGPDSLAVASVSPRLKRIVGRLAYGVAFLSVLLKWRRHQIRLVCEAGDISCEAFYVAKGRFFAGPWSFAPEAELASPLLHVIALKRARRRDYARFIWALARRRDIKSLPGVVAFTCNELTAEAHAALPMQADGDIVATLPTQLKLRADPLSFC